MDEGIRDSPPPKWLSVTGQPLDLDLPHGFLGTCSSISNFERIDRLGEGTYGVVSRARDTRTSKIVALKEVRIDPNERQNGIPITTLREISILRSLKHRNIINVFDVAVGTGPDPSSKPNGRQMSSLDEIHMVMEYAGKVGKPPVV
ncbi:MAG: hypothetical protein M1825_003999 [Sarcosagium campestre]|nr:MAG: hypothetical protein M1825_003999 [Sarcosagium campestre]